MFELLKISVWIKLVKFEWKSVNGWCKRELSALFFTEQWSSISALGL